MLLLLVAIQRCYSRHHNIFACVYRNLLSIEIDCLSQYLLGSYCWLLYRDVIADITYRDIFACVYRNLLSIEIDCLSQYLLGSYCWLLYRDVIADITIFSPVSIGICFRLKLTALANIF